jgi:hypothetical protein
VTVQTLVSDAVIWATILLVVVGATAGVSIAAVAMMGRPGGRLTPEAARATMRRILGLAAIAYGAAFVSGLIVGMFQ